MFVDDNGLNDACRLRWIEVIKDVGHLRSTRLGIGSTKIWFMSQYRALQYEISLVSVYI